MAHFERVEWKFIPDPATAAAALQTGEVDWVERPLFDLIAKLKATSGVSVDLVDPFGFFAILWLNNAAPPFDNAKLRHAILPALKQDDVMQAVLGDLPGLSQTRMGMFTPGSPFASDAGMEIITGRRDVPLAKRLIAESGYKGETIVIMAPEIPESRAMAEVTRALFQELGLNVDYQAMDWGTLSARAREHRSRSARRLELLLCRVGRAVAGSARQQYSAWRGEAEPGDGGTAHRLVRCARPDDAEAARREDATGRLRGSAVHSAWSVFHPVCLPDGTDRVRPRADHGAMERPPELTRWLARSINESRR